MSELGKKLGKAFSQAIFDERFYRLVHPDVNRAINAGWVESGYSHYCSHGRGERRAARRNFLPGLSVPRYMAFLRPDDDYLSGARIVLRDESDARFRFRLYRVGGSRTLERVAEAEFDAHSELEDGAGHLYWEPIERSRGQKFVARMWRLDDERKTATPVDFLMADSLVYSSPEVNCSVPWLVAMSPLTACNLNCIHCISRATRASSRELSPAVWKTFQDMAARKQIGHMCADYSGDIFWAQGRKTPWLDRLIDLDVELRFDTHANNLTPELADKILNSKMSGINFSIDSHDPEVYPTIRKGARPLPEVLANIAMFMRKRNFRRQNLQTSISLVMMKRNLNSLVPAIDFAAAHKIDIVQGLHLMVFTPDMVEEHVLLDLKTYRETYEAAEIYAREKGVKFMAPAPLKKRKARTGHSPCTFPWAGAQITGDGNVSACCMPGSSMGNLNEQSLHDIWTGQKMRDFRSRVNTPNPPKPCDACGLFRYENNFASYVPGLSKPEQDAFAERILAQL